MADSTERTQKKRKPDDGHRIKVYGNSDIFYWWPVWLYGSICAGITYFLGEAVTTKGQDVLFFPNLGLVFRSPCLY